MDCSLGLEFVEDLALKTPRVDFERRELDREFRRPGLFSLESLAETLAIFDATRVVWFERRVFPVFVEGGLESLKQVALLNRRQSDVPFKAIDQRRLGEV